MRSKYFPLASVLIVTFLSLSSCLNSSTDNVEYSPDAQIYAFSLSSKSDTAALLSATKFTIDQVNGKIFNNVPLPYLFDVDSVLLSLRGSSTYTPFSQVMLTLDEDSTYRWQSSDSVAIKRLSMITTTAHDGITKKEYRIELNIYLEDPYILSWQKLDDDYLTATALSQKTILLNGHLITYYLTPVGIAAVMTDAGNTLAWSTPNLVGLPLTTDPTTVTATDEGLFALDTSGNTVYHSADGITWHAVSSGLHVKAIYGTLPSTEEGKLLLAVEQDESLRFAVTNDFSEVVMMNNLPEQFPLSGFSAVQVDDPASYSIKHLLLAGGNAADNTLSNRIWILQQKEGVISWILSRIPESLTIEGSSLFYYDNKPYLMAASAEKNTLYFSENYGLDWVQTGTNQAFPAEFQLRTNASISTDSEHNIWVFGGISAQQTQLVDVWRGRLNKYSGM